MRFSLTVEFHHNIRRFSSRLSRIGQTSRIDNGKFLIVFDQWSVRMRKLDYILATALGFFAQCVQSRTDIVIMPMCEQHLVFSDPYLLFFVQHGEKIIISRYDL